MFNDNDYYYYRIWCGVFREDCHQCVITLNDFDLLLLSQPRVYLTDVTELRSNSWFNAVTPVDGLTTGVAHCCFDLTDINL